MVGRGGSTTRVETVLTGGVSTGRRGGSPLRDPVASRSRASPPEPHRAWTAQIEWRGTGDGSRFCVVATAGEASAAIAESAPMAWPPVCTAVPALAEAVQELEASLLAAGWHPLPRGSTWYAKRFAWEPAGAGAGAAGAMPSGAAARRWAITVLTGACVLGYVFDWESPIRAVLGVVFVLLAPGLAITEALDVRDPVVRLAIASATSLAAATLVAVVLIYIGAFTAGAALGVLAAITLGSVLVARARAGAAA